MNSKIFIDHRATILGDVTIGDNSSIWPGAVIRADLTGISIGCYTSIQDNCVIHGERGYPVNIGNFVTAGHGSVIHGSKVEDCVVIGMNAIVQNGSIIGKGSIIAAGTNIKQGTVIPPFSMAIGNPMVIKENRFSDYILNLEGSLIYYFLSRYYIKSGTMNKEKIEYIYQKANDESIRINNILMKNETININEIILPVPEFDI